MSRRIALFALAASSALIVAPAFADRECFENSCRLPEAVEPPPQANAAAEDAEVEPAPRVVLPGSATLPSVQAKAVKPPTPAAAEPRNGTAEAPPADMVRVTPGTSARAERPATAAATSAASIGAAPAGAIVIAIPNVIYPAYHGAPVYAVAPNAKIISIDPAD